MTFAYRQRRTKESPLAQSTDSKEENSTLQHTATSSEQRKGGCQQLPDGTFWQHTDTTKTHRHTDKSSQTQRYRHSDRRKHRHRHRHRCRCKGRQRRRHGRRRRHRLGHRHTHTHTLSLCFLHTARQEVHEARLCSLRFILEVLRSNGTLTQHLDDRSQCNNSHRVG